MYTTEAVPEIGTASFNLAQQAHTKNQLHQTEKWRGWDLRVHTKSWELSEQESQNQSSFHFK
jgi:hypothetical protein